MITLRTWYAVVAVLLAQASAAVAQSPGTIIGRVIDSVTRTPKRGAEVQLAASQRVTTTNARGEFTLRLVPAGQWTLRVRAIGARTMSTTVQVIAGDTARLDIVLAPDPFMLDLVRVSSPSTEREAFGTTPNVGATVLGVKAIEAVPRLGASDVVRVVQLLPGVQAKNDFSTGFTVHGGETDQNLVLLDGYPVYNPFHVGGLFSTFISSTISDVQLLTGAFPARYGDRLSSVLDVRSRDEHRPGVHGDADLSVIAATATVGGDIDNGRGSWSVAGRRTYADQVIRLVSSERLPYHFRDEQAGVSYALPGGARLAATLYDGRDVVDANFAELPDSNRQGAGGGAFAVSWGNLVAGATVSKTFGAGERLPTPWLRFGDSVLVEQRISISRFSSDFDIGSRSATATSALSDTRLGGMVTSYRTRHDRTFGYDVAAFDVRRRSTTAQGSIDDHSSRQRATRIAAYVEDLWRAAPSFLVSSGLRAERETSHGSALLLPRVSLKRLWSDRSASTVAVGRSAQTTHSLGLEDSAIRLFDVWHLSDADKPVSTAWQFVVGHEHWLGRSRLVRIEGFYKSYSNLLEYNVEEDSRVDADDFVAADGNSYGADVIIRQLESGPVSGWITYSYTMSTRVQNGVRYAPGNDRRHALNAVLSWRTRTYVTGLRVGYGSGLPYTEIIGSLPRREFDPVRLAWGSGGGRSWREDIGGARNGARLPPTRRIDVFVQRAMRVRGAAVTPYLSVVNAGNARNVLFYVYDFTTTPGNRRTVSQFPIIPSAGVSVAF